MQDKIFQNKLSYNTKKFELTIYYKSKAIELKWVSIDKEKFSEMCKQGCNVYKKCLACPPYSPSFLDIEKWV